MEPTSLYELDELDNSWKREISWTKSYCGISHYNHPQKFLCTVKEYRFFVEASIYWRIFKNGLYPVRSFTSDQENVFFKEEHLNPLSMAKIWCEKTVAEAIERS